MSGGGTFLACAELVANGFLAPGFREEHGVYYDYSFYHFATAVAEMLSQKESEDQMEFVLGEHFFQMDAAPMPANGHLRDETDFVPPRRGVPWTMTFASRERKSEFLDLILGLRLTYVIADSNFDPTGAEKGYFSGGADERGFLKMFTRIVYRRMLAERLPASVREEFEWNEKFYICSLHPGGFGLAAAEDAADARVLCNTDSLVDLIGTEAAKPNYPDGDGDAVAENVIQLRISIPQGSA